MNKEHEYIKIGDVFGKLTVSYLPSEILSHSMIRCSCSCGINKSFRASNLVKKSAQSCGCSRIKTEPGDLSRNFKYAVYRRGAEVRKIQFNLTREYFYSLVKNSCHYCGEEPALYNGSPARKKKRDSAYMSGIDRKDPDLGYDIENCVTCCSVCNMSKGSMGYEEFKSWILKVYKFSFKR